MKFMSAAAILVGLVGLAGPAAAAGPCPDPFWPDVLGQCVCPNLKEKIAFTRQGYDMAALCPVGSSAAHLVNASNRGQRWSWDQPVLDKDGNPVLDDDGNPIINHVVHYDGDDTGQNGFDLPANAFNVKTGGFH